MGAGIRRAGVGVGILLTGCGSAAAFECEQSEECTGASSGTCEPSGYCSFPDATCPTGQRYGQFASAQLRGTCVPASQGSSGGANAGTDDASTTSTASTTGTTQAQTTVMITTAEGSGSDTTTTGSSSDGGTTSSTTVGSSSSGASTGSTGSAPQVLWIPASISECSDPVSLDLDACRASTGVAGMSVDLTNSALDGQLSTAYLAFDTSAVEGTLMTARLHLTTTDLRSGSSKEQSGEIWTTVPFSLASLSSESPAVVGTSPIAADLGPVGVGEEVVWSLELDALPGEGVLHRQERRLGPRSRRSSRLLRNPVRRIAK